MYKLVILIETLDDWLKFEEGWPEFLAHAEAMPGLRREAASRVDRVLHGEYSAAMIHELFFDDLPSAAEAMASEQGQAAGRTLQRITDGRVTLLFANHLEDDLENIRRHKGQAENEPPGNRA